MQGIKILGTGSYTPPFVVNNEDFTAFVDTSDEWIRTRTGMQRRHVAKDEQVWYMGALAAQRALENAALAAQEIDLLIVTTATSEYRFPSTGCMIQNHIGATNAFAFDIGAACAGVPYAIDMARRYLHTGDVRHVLVVSSEVLTGVTNYSDRGTCVLTGDGAGACVIAASDGIYGSFLHSDASGAQYIYCKHKRQPSPFFNVDEVTPRDPFPVELYEQMYMNGREVYKFATKAMPLALQKACEKAGISPQELKLIVPHQANLRILETAAKNLNLSMDHVFVNIEEYGNTSSASIAIGLDECARNGRLQHGDLVCVVGFGAGLVYGACVFTF